MQLSNGVLLQSVPNYAHLDVEHRDRWQTWIDALRSNQYKQFTDELHDTIGGFCCLGVGCDVVTGRLGRWVPSGIRSAWTRQFFEDTEGARHFVSLPPSVTRFYGLPADVGLSVIGVTPTGLQAPRSLSLMKLNDRFRATFTDIALILEIALDGGFSTHH